MWTVRVERCWSEMGKGYSHKSEFRAAVLSEAALQALQALRQGICEDTWTGRGDGEVMHSALLEVIYEHR